MFCTKCGVQLEDLDGFCHQCGTATGRGIMPVPRRRLMRTISGKKIAGVCSGLAEYLDVDPIIIRLIWVLLSLGLPPAGILGYIIAWIIIPREPVPAAFTTVSVPQA